MTADPFATPDAVRTAARVAGHRPDPSPGAPPGLRPLPARRGHRSAETAGNRLPQTVRIENGGLIIEFCDDVPADRLLAQGADPAAAPGQTWLHLRIRSDGLLAHAVLQVATLALARFVRSLDDLLRIGHGEASLTGTSRYPSALRLDAEAGMTRMTLLACPLLATPVRVVIEALELTDEDVQSIRRWAAGHCEE